MADLKNSEAVLNWRPRTAFGEGLTGTIEWYVGNRNKDFVRLNLERLLYERDVIPDHGWD